MTATVTFTSHTLDRAVERVWPGCDRDGALAQLVGLAAHLIITDTAPKWLHEGSRDAPDGFAVVADDIAFVLRRNADGSYIAVTCVTRASGMRRRRPGCGRKAAAARACRARDGRFTWA